MTKQQQNDYIALYQSFGADYLANNPNATSGDAGAYALKCLFGDSIHLYFAPTGTNTYSPIGIDPNSDKIASLAC